MLLHDNKSLASLKPGSWEYKAFYDFRSIILSPDKVFPCTLGVAGFGADQLRFNFIKHDLESDTAANQLAAALQSFVPNARSFGKNTSLVVFFRENRDLGVEAYECIFWNILNKLHNLDSRPWPKEIPHETDHNNWEFSFSGEPIFVVCNTPSHKARMSRYAGNFMITFQPRWVFDGVIGKDAPNADRIKSEIRRRLSIFDAVPISPDLGVFGDEENREWKQYFLSDDNQVRATGCPFNHSRRGQAPKVLNTGLHNLTQVVNSLLPPTGSVEVQIDTPFRIHTQHKHAVDETLHIIKGSLDFHLQGETISCGVGDRLLLPAETLHSSVAGEEGCTYVIATRLVFSDRFELQVPESAHV